MDAEGARLNLPSRVAAVRTGWLANLCAQFLPFFGFFACAPLLVSSLGSDRFGTLMLLTIVPQIAGQLDWGLATAATRLLAGYGTSQQPAFARRAFLETMVAILVIGFAFALLLLCFSSSFIAALQLAPSLGSGQASAAVEATALWAFVSFLGIGAALPLRAHQQYRTLAFIQAGGGLAFWLAATGFAMAGVGVAGIVLSGAVLSLITAIALLCYSKVWLAGGAMPSVWLLPQVWRYSAGAFVAQVSSLLTYHLDKLLVGVFVSPAAAGIYTACANMAGKLLAAIAAISTFSFPQTTVLVALGDHGGIKKMFIDGSRINLSLAMACGIPAMALAEPFLRLWLGAAAASEFSYGFSLLILGYLCASASVVAANVCSGMGDTRTPALFAVIGGALTLLLCVLLAPRFGSLGAAVAATVGMSQALVLCAVIAIRLGPGVLAQLTQLLWPTGLVSLFVGALLKWSAFLAEGWWSLLILAGLGSAAIAATAAWGIVRGSTGSSVVADN